MTPDATIFPGGDAEAVARAAAVLRGGGLVGMPTETVYGLACDALNPRAVAGVFAAKERPSFDPLIVHVRDVEHAQTLALFDETAAALAEAFWPGPMTLVLPRRVDPASGEPTVPGIVTAGLDRVGLRVPAHPMAQALLRDSGLALAAPSANRFGSISPTTAQHVADELAGRVDLILDGGACKRGVESTVVSVDDDGVTVLRLGATTVEQIERALPGVAVQLARPTSDPGHAAPGGMHDETHRETGPDPVPGGRALPAPGMTERHYAPRTPLRLVQSSAPPATAGRLGLLALGDLSDLPAGYAEARSLSPAGDLTEAAANLFALMRELDGLGLDGITAVAVPDTGLGRAINDRLRRASVAHP